MMMTSMQVQMPLPTAQKMALYMKCARSVRSGNSILRLVAPELFSGDPLIEWYLSATRFKRVIKTDTVDATALSRNAGAVTCEITVESWMTLKASVMIQPNSIARPSY